MAEPGFFDRIMLAGLSATAEGLFPENDLGAPDWKSTDLTARTLSYLNELPPPQRRLLWVLFFAVELLAPFLAPGFSRFSSLPPRRRAQVVRRWRRSPYFLLRVLGDALKASTTMMYMSHPSVLEHIEERKPRNPVALTAVNE
jgi:hypothetical protein